MVTALEVYREFAAQPRQEVSVQALEQRGMSRGQAQTMLWRLVHDGAGERSGVNRVRLFAPGESKPAQLREDPIVRELRAQGAKPTGFTVLPRRYPGARPKEFLVRSGKVAEVAARVQSMHPELHVLINSYEANDSSVCLYADRVQGEKASFEEALVHVFRHAPRPEFALALQAVLQETTKLNWTWLRRQPEWGELAGVFVAVNELAGRRVFPEFRKAQPPSLSYDELETIAQPVIARGSSPGA